MGKTRAVCPGAAKKRTIPAEKHWYRNSVNLLDLPERKILRNQDAAALAQATYVFKGCPEDTLQQVEYGECKAATRISRGMV